MTATTTTLVGFGFTDPTTTPDTTTLASNLSKVYDTLCQMELVMENDLSQNTRDIANNTHNIALQLEEIKGGLGYVVKGFECIDSKLHELRDIRHSIDELNSTIYKFCKLLTHAQSCK